MKNHKLEIFALIVFILASIFVLNKFWYSNPATTTATNDPVDSYQLPADKCLTEECGGKDYDI